MEVHGGPQAQYGYTFFHELQLLASRGYVVFYSNPRGSIGYGRAFVEAIRNDWGNRDFADIMAGTDYLPVSVPGVQVYTKMFRSNEFAIGSTIAVVLLVIVASVIIPYLATSLQSEHEL